MAVNSTQYALYASSPLRKIPNREYGGVTHTAYGEYTAAAMLGGGANGCINMVIIPAGSRFKDMKLEWAALGASTDLRVGDQFVCARFMTGASGAVASTTQRGSGVTGVQSCGNFNGATTGPSEQSAGYLFTCDTTIIVSNLAGSATGLIQLWVEYTYV